jgi:glutamine synthetase-like protein
MEPKHAEELIAARQFVVDRGLEHVKVGVFDVDGILRGKYLSRDKFLAALDKGFGVCDVVLGWDSNDQLYDNVKFTGWHSAYPDAPIEGNAYERKHPPKRRLPATLDDAAARLAASAPVRVLFGEPFVEHYVATRQWEEREFRKAVTDWELARYFEII